MSGLAVLAPTYAEEPRDAALKTVVRFPFATAAALRLALE
jgi:hypothetical protein